MELKTYQASSMAEALAAVKQDLGPHAVIMHTRTFKRGGVWGVGSKTVVEITAGRDLDTLPAVERRVMIGPEIEGSPGGRPENLAVNRQGGLPRAEGAAMNRSAGKLPESTQGEVESAPPISLREEMNELRTMVRELLHRSSNGAGSSVPDVPEELNEYYTCLIKNAVADEVACKVLDRARERLAECRAGLRVRRISGKIRQGDGSSGNGEYDVLNEQEALRRLVPAIFLESVERMLPTAEPVQLNTDGTTKYVALVGPTGVGKTTTIAKLAAHFKLREGKRVGLIRRRRSAQSLCRDHGLTPGGCAHAGRYVSGPGGHEGFRPCSGRHDGAEP